MMTNKEWVEFLKKEWNISGVSAKTMLHLMHEVKKSDSMKKELQKECREKEDK